MRSHRASQDRRGSASSRANAARRSHGRRAVARLTGTLLVGLVVSDPVAAQWTQWGGPRRDFTADAAPLAPRWPESGPATIWKRPLGDGYATILVDDGTLYTMYRAGDAEFTVALAASDGRTLWEHRNPSPFTQTMAEFGPGPHSTPLVLGERLYSVGTNGALHCFEKQSGKVLWTHDLIKEFDGELRARGYSCSPIAFEGRVILPLGSEHEGPGAVAFDAATGRVAWRVPTYHATYGSPLLIRFDGQDQLVFFMCNELIGVNPRSGKVLWSIEHKNSVGVNASTPIWNGKDTLFCANAYDGGARAVRLVSDGGGTRAESLWYSQKMKLHHGNAMLIGDRIYASSGQGTAIFMGVELATGKVVDRRRGFSKATCVGSGDHLILLDEDGNLALAAIGPKGLEIQSTAKVAEPFAWAAPTLVGTRLYLRDRKNIMALDLR